MSSKIDFPLVMDSFAIRQFNNPDYTGTQVLYDVDAFEQKVNDLFASGNYPLVDGYAPFCKHLFIPNFANVKCGYAEISNENKSFIKSGYEARKENELAVLIQWIDQTSFPAPEAIWLDIILYRFAI
jgi:5,10-methylenetetrahydrofolate reductase